MIPEYICLIVSSIHVDLSLKPEFLIVFRLLASMCLFVFCLFGGCCGGGCHLVVRVVSVPLNRVVLIGYRYIIPCRSCWNKPNHVNQGLGVSVGIV
jgi:hypothetical protein